MIFSFNVRTPRKSLSVSLFQLETIEKCILYILERSNTYTTIFVSKFVPLRMCLAGQPIGCGKTWPANSETRRDTISLQVIVLDLSVERI